MMISEEVKKDGLLDRSGIPTCDYLFSYLNFVSGYHPINDSTRTKYPYALLVIEEF
jgi:hypothetical protein